MKNTSAFIASLFPADAIEALQFAIRILEDPMFDMYPLPNDKRVEFLNRVITRMVSDLVAEQDEHEGETREEKMRADMDEQLRRS